MSPHSPLSRFGRWSVGTDRGQTQIDFAVGAGVFLIALAFVVGFVPSLFEPFSTAQSASPLVSDRVAAGTVDLLGTSAGGPADLHAPTNPGVLSPACTVLFFTGNTTLNASADCPFNASDDLNTLLGHDGDLQVVLHELNESPTVDGTGLSPLDVETRHGTFTDVETIRTSAEPPRATDDVTVSRRIVSLNGEQYRLAVRVW